MEIYRFNNQGAINEAERLRGLGRVEKAAEFAEELLSINGQHISAEIADIIAQYPDLLINLAQTSRTHVDARKSAANRAKSPFFCLSHLAKAHNTLKAVYKNPTVIEALREVENPQFFLAEMARDEAKVLEAAAPLYPKRSRFLLSHAQDVLENAQLSLKVDEGLASLIEIEKVILMIKAGRTFHQRALYDAFLKLKGSYQEVNPDRVAAIAAVLLSQGEQVLGNVTKQEAENTYQAMLEKNPEWSFMLSDALKKKELTQKRALLFKITGPFMMDPFKSRILYQGLMTDSFLH